MAPRPSYDVNSELNRLVRRSDSPTVDDVAAVVSDALKGQRHELVEHIDRIYRLMLSKLSSFASRDDSRFSNLHRRIAVLESELRLLRRKGTP